MRGNLVNATLCKHVTCFAVLLLCCGGEEGATRGGDGRRGRDTVLTVTTNHKLLNIDDPAIIFTDFPRVYLVTLVLAA